MTLIFGHDFYRYDFFRHEFLKRFVLSVTQTFISLACFSRARLWKSKRFFFPSVRCKKEGMLQGVLNGDRGNWGKNRDDFHCMQMSLVMSMRLIRNCKIEWLRTTTTVKHASTHDQNHVTDHFSCVLLRIRWVVELFRVVATTENILLAFCRLVNSRISSFRKKVFNSPVLSEREAKYVSCA